VCGPRLLLLTRSKRTQTAPQTMVKFLCFCCYHINCSTHGVPSPRRRAQGLFERSSLLLLFLLLFLLLLLLLLLLNVWNNGKSRRISAGLHILRGATVIKLMGVIFMQMALSHADSLLSNVLQQRGG
jgi:hypothetical protein